MRRQGQYSNSVMNPAVAAQMHQVAAQRMQHSTGLNNNFAEREGSLSAEEERRSMPTSTDGQLQYGNSVMNPTVAAKMHQVAAQRMQHGTGLNNNFAEREGSLSAEEERRSMPTSTDGQLQYGNSVLNPTVAAKMHQVAAQRMNAEEERRSMPTRTDGQWQWERDGPKGSKPALSHGYDEGQGSDSSRGFYHGQDLKYGSEKSTRNEVKESGFEDNNLSVTFEGLEQKFLQDFLKLTKEHQDAEDAENTRHRERLSEINMQYHEKLLSVRARQAAQREEFLQKESQVRHQQYQLACMGGYQRSGGPNEAHGLGPAGVGGASTLGNMHRPYPGGHSEPYAERSEYQGTAGERSYDPRAPYPGGRAYNAGGRHF